MATSALSLLTRMLVVSLVDDCEDQRDYQESRFAASSEKATSSNGDKTEFQFGKVLSYILLFFLIFGMSATVELKSLKKQLTNKFGLGTGIVLQFLVMPFLGFLSVIILRPQEGRGWTMEMGIILLVITSSPGGTYSNWWCSIFNADLALSVAMTTVSSILSLAFLPFNLFLYTFLAYGKGGDDLVQALDYTTIFKALAIVLVGIAFGLFAGYRCDNDDFRILCNRVGSLCGITLVLFSIFLSSGGGGTENSFWNQHWAFYIGVAFPCLVGLVLAHVVSSYLQLPHPETVAIAIECCYQNTGIATSVAIAMYGNDPERRAQAVAVPLVYGFVEAGSVVIYCIWAWKMGWTKAPASDPLWVVLTKTYEVSREKNDRSPGNNGDNQEATQGLSQPPSDEEVGTLDGLPVSTLTGKDVDEGHKHEMAPFPKQIISYDLKHKHSRDPTYTTERPESRSSSPLKEGNTYVPRADVEDYDLACSSPTEQSEQEIHSVTTETDFSTEIPLYDSVPNNPSSMETDDL